jgi:alcohol dehydrogenase (cytochrome c)
VSSVSSGKVEARDAKTGDLVWSRPTVQGHMGYLNGEENGITGGDVDMTWPGDMWKMGGAATWNGGTYDPDTDLLFFGTGNPAPWNSHLRPGDNLYSSSRLAIDPDTGEIVWHYQTTPHDGWDFDGVNELIAFDYKEGRKTIKAAATADRNGFFYVLNRENGEFIRAVPFVENITWAEGSMRTVARSKPTAAARALRRRMARARRCSVPSFLGGKNWMPMAYSQDTGYFYVPSNEWGMDIWNEPINYKKGAAYLGAGFTIKPIFEDHIGALKAIDPKTGEIKWTYKNKAPLWGGVLATAGGLVFTGNPEGYLMAFDAETGEMLYKFNTGSGVVSSPITWKMDGEQYVTDRLRLGRCGTALGWRGRQGSEGHQPGWFGLDLQAACGRNGGQHPLKLTEVPPGAARRSTHRRAAPGTQSIPMTRTSADARIRDDEIQATALPVDGRG